VNDHRDTRHRRNEPAWPTGDDPDANRWPPNEQSQERTGFWSPLWEDDNESPAPRPARANGRPANGHNGHNGSNGHNGNGHDPRTRQVAGPAKGQQATQAIRRPPNAQDGPTVALPGARVRTARDNSGDPTVLLPPTGHGARREPDLLTHREGEFDEDADLLADEDQPLTDDERKRRRKKIWRRVRRTMYVLIVLAIVGPVLAFFIAYQTVTVPSPDEIASGQLRNVTLKYADNSEMTTVKSDGASRIMVHYEDLPEPVLHAVFAAEDATFMSNAGFDLQGVVRSAWNQLGGGSGGGSTITQQYIKQATGQDQATLTRKGIEVVKAYKMNRTYSKQDIITAYLNTIYLGRNSYGIAAAAKAYFNKDLKALTPSEAALLAGMIQGPGRYKDTAYMQRRWNYVMDQLVNNHWFDPVQRKAEKFPTPVPYETTKSQALTGPRGLLEQAVFDELASTDNGHPGLTREDIQRQGFTIVTTIDQQAQSLAEKAVDGVMKGQPTNLHPGLVAVDPKTGQIKAYYGGSDGAGVDWAATQQEPGSSFKPFDLVGFLEKGKGLGEVFDGSSPRTFDRVPRRNSDGAQCPNCTVAEAMKRSINTVFFDIGVNVVKTRGVADAAHQAGITSPLSPPGKDPTDGIAIGGDDTRVSTTEMASAYATFAARGMYRAPHMVAKVLNPDGSVYWQAADEEKMAFADGDPRKNEQIARNVTESLLPIPGWSKIGCADGRLCAGKTGTQQLGETADNSKAWMVGYTPQLSTAVSMSGDKDGLAIKNAQKKIIYGSGLPGKIWQTFMDSYHKTFKLPKEDFGKFDPIGKPDPASDSAAATDPNKPNNNNSGQQGQNNNNNPNNPNQSTSPSQPNNPGRPGRTTTSTPPPIITLPGGGGGPGPGDSGG
jgi:membrane peptidoglycan carboxypeptidase